ncbi:hypothetical protein MP228_005743 [Amoeboaphelidium protococcarum]|nr:hypothetical protein MP228_005743 [Amoeboaphelidium protococcarum]
MVGMFAKFWLQHLVVVLLVFLPCDYSKTIQPAGMKQPGQPVDPSLVPDPSTPKLVAYYLGYTAHQSHTPLGPMLPWEVAGNQITHLIYGFFNASLQPDGSYAMLTGDNYADHARILDYSNPQNCKQCTFGIILQLNYLRKRNPHMSILASLGGWTLSDHISNALLTEDSRRQFAKSVIDFMIDYGFDGIDVDWEFPVRGGLEGSSKDPNDGRHLTLFIKELRRQILELPYQKYYYIIVTLYYEVELFAPIFELAEMQNDVDWYNVMSYEMVWNSTATRHHSPLFSNTELQNPNQFPSVDSVLRLYMAMSGVPAQKFIFGITEYGKSYSRVEAPTVYQGNGLHLSYSGDFMGVLTYDAALMSIAQQSFQYFWDDYSKVPILFSSAKQIFHTFDNVRSVSEKTKYSLENSYGGIFMYDVSYDKGLYVNESSTLVSGAYRQLMEGSSSFRDYIQKFSVPCVPSRRFTNINCDPDPPEPIDMSKLAQVYSQCTVNGKVSFVFTGGPDIKLTRMLLEQLRTLKITGTMIVNPSLMFTVSQDALQSLLYEANQDGHFVTHAGYQFQSWYPLTRPDVETDVLKGDYALGNILGQYSPLLSVPYGQNDFWVLNVLFGMNKVVLSPNKQLVDFQTQNVGSMTETEVAQLAVQTARDTVMTYSPESMSWIVGIDAGNAKVIENIGQIASIFRNAGYRQSSMQDCLSHKFPAYQQPLPKDKFSDIPYLNVPYRKRCVNPGLLSFGFYASPSQKLESILNWLLLNRLKATFFVAGSQLNDNIYYRNLVTRAYVEGHTIAHNSFNYQSYRTMSKEEIIRDLRLNAREIAQFLGVYSTVVFPPFAQHNGTVRTIIAETGFNVAFADILPFDKSTYEKSKNISVDYQSYVKKLVTDSLKNKYDNSKVSSMLIMQKEADFDSQLVQDLISLAQNQGYKFGRLEDCQYNVGMYKKYVSRCGDYVCDYQYGENCNSCSQDCPCPDPPSVSKINSANSAGLIFGPGGSNGGIMIWLSVFLGLCALIFLSASGIRLRKSLKSKTEGQYNGSSAAPFTSDRVEPKPKTLRKDSGNVLERAGTSQSQVPYSPSQFRPSVVDFNDSNVRRRSINPGNSGSFQQ